MHDRAKAVRPVEAAAFDVEAVRRDFPILSTEMNGRPLVYLDNGATTQKPRAVIEAISHYYEHDNANIHRGVYSLSQRATSQFDKARGIVARFLNAPEPAECIFVRGVTEAINLVAMSWGRTFLKTGDEILLTALEHHSNIVPWQLAAEATGAKVRTLPMNDRGELEYDRLDEFITSKTKFVAIQHVSNALGTVHDVSRIIEAARKIGALVLIDGAQHVGHFPTDLQEIGGGGGGGLRFLLLQRAQIVWSDRRRRAVGKAGVAGKDAAISWWWRHDRRGEVGGNDVCADPCEV